MKIKVAMLLCAWCLLAVLTSCGNSSSSNLPDVDMDAPKTSEELSEIRRQIGEASPVTRGSGMNEKELLADLNAHDDLFQWFSPDAGFVVASIQINQRDTVNKSSDEIYATITAVNEYSSYSTEFYLYYEYYSEGGWRLSFLTPSGDGVYQINYWPQEDDVSTYWSVTNADENNPSTIEECVVKSQGDQDIIYRVTFSRFSDLAAEYAQADVRFYFENGVWYTTPISYLNNSQWRINPDTACGLYRMIQSSDNYMDMYVINLYAADDNSVLWADYYNYTLDKGEQYGIRFDKKQNYQVSFNLDSVDLSYGTGNIMVFDDGSWRYKGTELERLNGYANGPLSENDAVSMIREDVERLGFAYWDSYESAMLAQGQDILYDLEKDYDFAAYREACVNYYSQVGTVFPDTLDPCMYTLYSYSVLNQFISDAPNPADYMDPTVYSQITYIWSTYTSLYYLNSQY